MDIDKNLAGVLIRKQNTRKKNSTPELPGGSLRRRLGGLALSASIGNASESVIQLKLLLTSSYVEM